MGEHNHKHNHNHEHNEERDGLIPNYYQGAGIDGEIPPNSDFCFAANRHSQN